MTRFSEYSSPDLVEFVGNLVTKFFKSGHSTQRRHHAVVGQDELENTAYHHETVKTVEERNEIALKNGKRFVDETTWLNDTWLI